MNDAQKGRRCLMAVFTALFMVASVMVVAPASAADTPEPDYEASFNACSDIESADFADVSSNHTNAEDIDCIAYYGITKGTSATTYSPSNAVTREHMALFLTRLAQLVGIEVVDNPSDPGFDDIGELSERSQTAIAQLKDLGVTAGTSDTTYSPKSSVTRGHMALFIKRLMNLITPMSDGDTAYGYVPADVAENEDDHDIAVPFTDLNSVTKGNYDAIEELYELGVVAGISATSYSPQAVITRASMAGFMAAVLDHSNVRPAGIGLQTAEAEEYGDVETTVVVSYRDDIFAPVEDQPIDVFSSTADNGGLNSDGECVTDTAGDVDQDRIDGDCVWESSDEITDEYGNIFIDGGAEAGDSATYYAWIGSEGGEEFDADKVDFASSEVTASKSVDALKVTSSINENAACDDDGALGPCPDGDDDDELARVVDLRRGRPATFTIQLQDDEGDDVKRAGVEIMVGVERLRYSNAQETTLETDKNGRATYRAEGPEDDPDDEPDLEADPVEVGDARLDTYTFDFADDDRRDAASAVERAISWVETDPMTTSAKARASDYVVLSNGEAVITASVTIYDQYGKGYRQASGQTVAINIGEDDDTVSVNRRGVATRRVKIDAAAGTAVPVVYDADPEEADTDIDVFTGALDNDYPKTDSVQVVSTAENDDLGDRTVHTLIADSNRFITVEDGDGEDADLLYGYSSSDLFINSISGDDEEGEEIDLAEFEKLLGGELDTVTTKAIVDLISYDSDGRSIIRVTTKAVGS